MMKRLRTIDVPKYRRTAKNRPRLGESTGFISASGLVYLKLFMMWLTCVALDFLVGFRFELLWPVWLMIRYLYDAFRIQTFASSFHYSAFSVFFVCITATSDLICYLFIPVQVLLFLASTYVWIQFVYQSTDRGFSTPSILLWGTFIGFEYMLRSRFDRATFYLAKSSWITAGLFSTSTNSIDIGGTSTDSARFEVYRPFAAHCLGYPIVTLGFRVKSYFSWRLKRRRMDVMERNEFFTSLLCDAVPMPYEGRFHLSTARQQLALEHEPMEYELDEDDSSSQSTQHQLDTKSTVVTSQPMFGCLNGSAPISSCVPCFANTGILSAAVNGMQHSSCQRKSRPVHPPKLTTAKQSAVTSKKSAKNGKDSSTNGNAASSNGSNDVCAAEGGDDSGGSVLRRPSLTLFGLPLISLRLMQCIASFVLLRLIQPIADRVSCFLRSYWYKELDRTRAFNPEQKKLNGWSKADEAIDVIDDVVHADEYESSKEEQQSREQTVSHSKRKAKRGRGRTPAVQKPERDENILSSRGVSPKPDVELRANGSPQDCVATTSDYRNEQHLENGKLPTEVTANLKAERDEARRSAEHFLEEKEILENALDGLRSEMRQLRANETALRAELSLCQSQDKVQKREFTALRAKLADSEVKVESLTKSLEAAKQSQQQVGRSKKERNGTDRNGHESPRELEVLRQQNQRLEKDLKDSLHDARHKQQQIHKLESRLKGFEHNKLEREAGQQEIKVYQDQINEMKGVISRLDKTLMSENRLKVDLFRALNDSKSQIESLTAQMRIMENERIQNGLAPSLKSDFMSQQLPNSLLASLAQKGYDESSTSTGSAPPTPASSSPALSHINNGPVLGIAPKHVGDLERLLCGNGNLNVFGEEASFSSPATPSLGGNSMKFPHGQLSNSRCSSPSSSELYNIMNGGNGASLGLAAFNYPGTLPGQPQSGRGIGNSVSPTYQ